MRWPDFNNSIVPKNFARVRVGVCARVEGEKE